MRAFLPNCLDSLLNICLILTEKKDHKCATRHQTRAFEKVPDSRRTTMPKRSRNSVSSHLARKMMLLMALLIPFVSAQQSDAPSTQKSGAPSDMPSMLPSDFPSLVPSSNPSMFEQKESFEPTGEISEPTRAPITSEPPSGTPTQVKSEKPTILRSSVPSAVPTGAPSSTPTVVPSMAPSLAPTTLIVADIFMVLRVVAFTMEGDILDFFNQQCTTFFRENIQQVEPRVSITESRLEVQRLLPQEDARRGLQGSVLRLHPLETQVVVTGRFSGASVVDDFDELLQSIVDANSTGLIDLLMESPVVYFLGLNSVATEDGLSPTRAPSSAPSKADGSADNDDSNAGKIAGIVVGSVFGFILLVALGYFTFLKHRSIREGSALPVRSMDSGGAPDSQNGNLAISAMPTWKEPDSDVEIFAAASDSQSLMGAQSYMGSMADTDLGGADTMSYAYSLDAGYVEPSLKSGVANTMVGTTIPGGENQSQTGQKPNQITREVIAPPGKLGIVIDTTIQGPVVHKVNKNSPLQGILFPGDIITAIDSTDTRSMTASAITALMVQTANQQRRLTVVTDESQ